MLVDGVTVEYSDDGRVRGAQARVLDLDIPSKKRLASGESADGRGDPGRAATRHRALRERKFLPDDRGDRHPTLSDRRNIVVIADEAHRSQYDFIDGFAAHIRDALLNASSIGFTGTPIEKDDANTRAMFDNVG